MIAVWQTLQKNSSILLLYKDFNYTPWRTWEWSKIIVVERRETTLYYMNFNLDNNTRPKAS